MKFANHLRMLVLTLATANAADAAVTATQKGGTLTIVGDASNDVIHVEGAGALGEVRVAQGVTPVPVDDFIGVRDIEIKSGDGNDAVNVSCLEIGGKLKANLGAGVDFLSADNVLRDGVTHRSMFIGGSMDVSLGEQAGDTFQCQSLSPVLTNSDVVTIGGKLSIRGATSVLIAGGGNSSSTGEQDIYVGSDLSIRSDIESQIEFNDVNVGGATQIALGAGDDNVRVQDSHFTRKFTVKLGAGNDLCNLESEVECNTDLAIDGGGDIDTLFGFALTSASVAGKSSAKHFEN